MANSADVLYCWQLGQGVKIIFGSQNRHKLKEINCISKQYGIEFISPNTNFNPVENGSTFEENSYIKAKEAAILSKNMALADDSGLCVDFLGGDPGIYSARYAETKSKCTEKLLKRARTVLDMIQFLSPVGMIFLLERWMSTRKIPSRTGT